jgi:hypothetical protein
MRIADGGLQTGFVNISLAVTEITMILFSTRRRPTLHLHTPTPPAVDPDVPLPTSDPDPSPPPDDVPPNDPTRAPEGDPPVKPPPVATTFFQPQKIVVSAN